VKMFDAGKTRMIALPYGEKNYDNTLSCFHTITERNGRTYRQIDGRTDRFAISISRISMLTRDKSRNFPPIAYVALSGKRSYHGHYNERRIGTRMRSIEWRHFQ